MKIKLLLLSFVTVIVIATMYLVWPELFGFCEKIQTMTRGEICRAPYAAEIGKPLMPFASALLLASLLAFLTTRTTFRRWAWFTLWYGLIAAVLMYLAARAGIDDGGFVSIPLFDIEKVAYLLAGIYVVISIPLLGISDLLVRRKR